MSEPVTNKTLSELSEKFLFYARAELGLAQQSIDKYRDCLRQIQRILGDRPAGNYSREDLRQLKLIW